VVEGKEVAKSVVGAEELVQDWKGGRWEECMAEVAWAPAAEERVSQVAGVTVSEGTAEEDLEESMAEAMWVKDLVVVMMAEDTGSVAGKGATVAGGVQRGLEEMVGAAEVVLVDRKVLEVRSGEAKLVGVQVGHLEKGEVASLGEGGRGVVLLETAVAV
jgi:hypothetical protein